MEDEEATSRGGDSPRKRPAEEITANDAEDPAPTAAPLEEEDGGGENRSPQSRAAGAPTAEASFSEEHAASEESNVEAEAAAAEMPEDEEGEEHLNPFSIVTADEWDAPWIGRGKESILLSMDLCENNHALSRVVRALRANQDVDEICFSDSLVGEMDSEETMDWGPLLREVSVRGKLECVTMLNTQSASEGILPGFFRRLFPALLRNSNVRALGVEALDLSAIGIIPYLDAVSNLASLTLSDCNDSSATHAFAKSLRRNTNLQTLCLYSCKDLDFSRQIFQSLSSPHSTSGLKKLVFETRDIEYMDEEPMKLYLESEAATIQCFELTYFYMHGGPGRVLTLVQGLIRSISVHEVVFSSSYILHQFRNGVRDYDAEDNFALSLASLVRNKQNLSTLRLLECNFFQYPAFMKVIAEILLRRDSPLRCLDLDILKDDGYYIDADILISVPNFVALLKAIASSTRLEQVIVQSLDPDPDRSFGAYYQVLLDNLPFFKTNEISLTFSANCEGAAANLLNAIKKNYNVQSVQCVRHGEDEPWLDEACQARLDFYLDRNRKLAQWTANPELVPRELWSYAVEMAMKAGIYSLYRSLYELSGEGIGLKQNAGINASNGSHETD